MVGSADQRAPVLQDERETLALALNHHLGLRRCAQPAVYGGSEQCGSTSARHLLDAPRGAVGKQYRRSLGKAGSAAETHEVEAQGLQVWQQPSIVQVVDDGSRAWSEAGFHGGFHREA